MNLTDVMRTLPILLGVACGAVWAQSTFTPIPVTTDNFVRAESHHYLGNAFKDAGGLAQFGHHRELMPVERQAVIRPNRDTFYSPAVVDLDAGPVTVTLPNAGTRYRAMEVINEDQYVVGNVKYATGAYTYDRESVGTRYALIAVRTLGDPQRPEGHSVVTEPGAPGASLIDKDEMCGLRWHRAEEWINVTLAGADSAQGDDRGAMRLGHRRHGNRLLVHVHADAECGRLRHG